jgi:hypothetical protein
MLMNQIDEGLLKITISDVPSFLDINISAVTLEYIEWYDYGGGNQGWTNPIFVKTLASNVPLGTEITILKSEVLRGNSVPANPSVSWRCYFLHIALSEYQTASSGGVPTVELTTTIELGVSGF